MNISVLMAHLAFGAAAVMHELVLTTVKQHVKPSLCLMLHAK